MKIALAVAFSLLTVTANAQTYLLPNAGTLTGDEFVPMDQAQGTRYKTVHSTINAILTHANLDFLIPTNAALTTTSTVTHPSVFRVGFYSRGDSPPLLYRASTTACTLNAGAGDSGSQIPSSDGKCWLADFPAGPIDARWFGAKGDNSNDDRLPLQRILNLGRVAQGVSGLTYRISQALTCPVDNAGLADIKLYAPAASFNNTDLLNRYTSTATVVLCQGQTVSPFTPINNFTINDLIIQSEVSDGRYVSAVSVRNINNLKINGVEAYGFPVGIGIRFASLTGNVEITKINCHDWTTNVNWTSQSPQAPQITCIEGDNDIVNSISTIAADIHKIRVKNLTFGTIALNASGYQTDGINLTRPTMKFTRVYDVYIENVGEGVDNFSVNGSFNDIVINNVYYYGIKNIHGASYNVFQNIAVEGAGLNCAIFGGGNNSADVIGNIINGLICNTVNQNNTTPILSTDACVKVSDNSDPLNPFVPRSNTVTNLTCNPGPNGDYAFVDLSKGTDNTIIGRQIGAARTATAVILHPENNNTIRSLVPTTLMAGLTNAQTITAGATAQVLLNLVAIDSLGEWNAGSKKWIARFPGTYRVNAAIRFALLNTGKTMSAYVYKNGLLALAFQQDYAEAESHLIANGLVTVASGDDIAIYVTNGDSVNRALTNDEKYTYLHITQQ